MDPRSDVELFQAVARRDQSAFEELCLRYQKPALALAGYVTHGRELAEEAVQDALLDLWLSPPSQVEQPRTWIMCVVTRKSLNRLRRARTEGRADQMQGARTAEASSALERLQGEELLAALREQLAAFPILDRQLVALHYGAGLSQREISAELSMPQQTIAARLKKTLEELRLRLTRHGFAAAAPLLTADALREALCNGLEPSPDFMERIRDQLQRAGRAPAPRAASQTWSWVALAAAVALLGGLWWSRERPAGGVPEDSAAPAPVAASTPAPLPVTPAPGLFRTWNFNTPDSAQDLKPMQDNWHWVPGGGPDGSGCMETDTQIFAAQIEVPIPRLPILVTCRFRFAGEGSSAARYGYVRWSKEEKGITIDEPVSVRTDGWMERKAYLTDQFTVSLIDRQPNGFNLAERKPGAVLMLFMNGRLRLDDLTLREIPPSEVPDVSRYLGALEEIDPSRRSGLVALPDLKSALTGKPLQAQFVEALDSYTAEAELPKAAARTQEEKDALAAPFSQSWVFDSPEAAQDFAVVRGSWHFLPTGGPRGAGCMESDGDLEFRLNIPDSKLRLPMLLTFSTLAPAVGEGPCGPALFPKSPRGAVAQIKFPNRKAIPFQAWGRSRFYLTPSYVDLWDGPHRIELWSSENTIELAGIGARLLGRYRISNLTLRAVSSDELPDVSACLAALAKIEPAKRQGVVPLPELKSEVWDQAVVVEFVPAPLRKE